MLFIPAGAAALALVLAAVRLCHPCRKVKEVLFCQKIPAYFAPGCSVMVITMSNVGEINSTVLQSANLNSITSIESNNAGITRIAENAFGSFPHLQSLVLDNNMLSQINPSWFRSPTVLSELKVAGNRIEDLNESALHGLTNLTKLSLENNQIQTIHPNSFRSQSLLADLDLSENRMTWMSPQIFNSLRSLRFIRLDQNPWNCSCDAKDFITALKDLKRRNKLNESMGVTCESPPRLKDQPVWDVSVCPASAPTQTPSETPTTSTAKTVTAAPLKPSSKSQTSSQSRPTYPPPTASSLSATLSSSETSVETKPPDAPTPSSTGTHVTVMTSSVTQSSNNSAPKAFTLIAVIAVLSVLLFVTCFMVGVLIRKRSNKSVTPECLVEKEEEREVEEESRSRPDQSAGCCQSRYSEVAWRKSFRGIRAKSANAVILTSPFCVSEKDGVSFQTEKEVPPEGSENPGQKKLVTESGAETGGEILLDIVITTDTGSRFEKQDDEDGNLHENPDCLYANNEMVPYLSIGTVQNKPSPGEGSTEGPGENLQRSKVIRRVSTWPPSAAQWQARCKMKEEQEGDSSAVWTQNVTLKLSDEVEMIVNKMEHLSCSAQDEKGEKTQTDARMDPRRTVLITNEPQKKKGKILDQVPLRQPGHNEELKCVENPANKSSSKAEARKDPKRGVTSRQRAEQGAVGSKAPSGGTSPDDETLLSGNEYAFMDLLHEVAQNNGRWTRERWRQIHVNRQRR
ncbi:uncharacterized protein LOC108233690 isoform X2 [Kryptolebias marmoratus]|uniref:uncharacterized protein LOC108233690 isoform X2 n=1 Tax=Kryptolebias marmoratus TaxID=37003 RepID=UPI000D530C22|nr:uncharacterized protein LOC108233690 isoform X2 [Kryptolebias marmoratus]